MDSVTASPVYIAQLGRREQTMKAIESKSFNLKHAETRDCSRPCFEGAKLKMYDRSILMGSIRQPVQLRKVQTLDRSAPILDKSVHIRLVERRNFLDTVLMGAQTFYNKVRTAFTKLHFGKESKVKPDPAVEKAFAQILADITESRASLKHVSTISDKSKPFLPSPYALQHTREKVLEDIKTTHKLHHVSQVVDKSRPFIPAKVTLRKANRSFLKEVETVSLQSLHHNNNICDKSAPVLPEGKVDLHKIDRQTLLNEIRSAPSASM
jgi:hypothetical protein